MRKKCIAESSQKITITVICLTQFLSLIFWCHLRTNAFFETLHIQNGVPTSFGCQMSGLVISSFLDFSFLLNLGLFFIAFIIKGFGHLSICNLSPTLRSSLFSENWCLRHCILTICNDNESNDLFTVQSTTLKLEIRFSLLSTNKYRVFKQGYNKVFRCRCGDVIKRIFVDTESFKTGQRGLEVVLVVLGVELEIKVECSTTTLSETKNFYFF